MLFLVESQVTTPAGMPPEEWQAKAQAESDYGIKAREDGKLVDIWRIAGQFAAFSLWDADNNEELHRLISGLPMFPHATFRITPLVIHPSTIRWNNMRAARE